MLNGDLDLDGHGGGAAESSGSPHDVCPDARWLASHGWPLLASAPPPSRLTLSWRGVDLFGLQVTTRWLRWVRGFEAGDTSGVVPRGWGASSPRSDPAK